MRIITYLIIISLLIFVPIQSYTEEKNTHEPYKILFIGNSYFSVNFLPQIVKDIINWSGREVFIDEAVKDGWSLYGHSKMSTTEMKIKEKNWDYVVLMDSGPPIAYPEILASDPVFSALETLCNKIRTNCESTKIIYCMPWAFEDGMTWKNGWTDTYEDMQSKIYVNTMQCANRFGIMIAPVGWAWRSVLIEKSFPLHYLFMEDWNHPAYRGSFLMALVIFSTIYQESTINISTPVGLSIEELTLFKTVASNMVLNYLNLWNITSIQLGISEPLLKEKIRLIQNYPNPYSSKTIIKYELSRPSLVDIAVYNVYGEKITTLVSDYKQAGNYSVVFNGSSYPNGTYFYKMISGDQIITKKMIVLK